MTNSGIDAIFFESFCDACMDDARFFSIFKHLPLRSKIVFHVWVPVQMIGLKIGKNRVVGLIFSDVVCHE